MGGELKVNFGSLEAAAADIASGARGLESRLDRLESELAPLRSDWTGAASEAYQVAKVEWDRATADINTLLSDLGRAVAQSNTEYQNAENQNRNRW